MNTTIHRYAMILVLVLSSAMARAQSAPAMSVEDLSARKKAVSENVKALGKELKEFEGEKSSVEKANRDLDNKISRLRATKQMAELVALQHSRDSLLNLIDACEKQAASLDRRLQEVDGNLNATGARRDDLAKIKDDVARSLIDEHQAYLERPFNDMTFDDLNAIKDKCRDYTADSNVSAFVNRINTAIANKSIYDAMVQAVNTPYEKPAVDRILASASQVVTATPQQKKEINELVDQLKNYPDGLASFKEYITEINKCREGVDYSMEYFETDIGPILKKNNLGARIDRSLHKVPYLHQKFEEFLQALKKDPNAHPKVEAEILNQ